MTKAETEAFWSLVLEHQQLSERDRIQRIEHGKRTGNTPCAGQPCTHRWGSSCSTSLAFCVGNRVSTSLR